MSTTPKKYIKGSRGLTVEDIKFDGEIGCFTNGDGIEVLEFYLGIWFNLGDIFGIKTSIAGNDDWINAYAIYDISNDCVYDDICIIVCCSDFSDTLYYRLSKEEKETLFAAMDSFCVEQENRHLREFLAY